MLPFVNTANSLVLDNKWKEARALFLQETWIKNYWFDNENTQGKYR